MKKICMIITAIALIFVFSSCGVDQMISTIENGKQQLQAATSETQAYINKEFGIAISLKDDLCPLHAKTDYNIKLAPLVYDSLTTVGADFTAQPCLAQSFAYDGSSWVFSIKSNIYFHDGTPLTAEYVADSIRAVMNDSSSYYHERTNNIQSVWASGNSVMITLKSPDALFPQLMDIPISKSDSGSGAVIGTGRYKFSQKGSGYELVKNDSWWNGKVTGISKIELIDVQGGDSFLYSFESHDIDAAAVMPGDNVQPYNITDFTTYSYNSNQLCYVAYNSKNRLIEDKVVRQAISYMIDRDTLISDTYGGNAAPSLFGVNPKWKYYDASLDESYAHDDAKASLLLTEAGYAKNPVGIFAKNGDTLEFKLLVNLENASRLNLAKQIASSLSEAGISVTVEEANWTQYNDKLKKGDFDLYIGEVKLPGNMDFSDLCRSGGSANFGKVNVPAVNDAMNNLKRSDDMSLAQNVKAFEAAFADELPVIPLFYASGTLYVAKNVKGTINPIWDNVYGNINEYTLG